ncbi:SDR family oxidoreductase [Fulvivirgaceae bacterium BMA12]|uniref:SDR family oxidoreductase n=1 Tax=Agaribacillus aureus TaxID=3051825 RepID=A0ABT8L1V1_9BACT|nr:SDR family oxidoreductase [Fulvivirgaceae bacterium BMA12]
MKRFENKAAIVVGGGSGIGAASAIALSGEGASVAIIDINEKNAGNTAEQITASGGSAIALAADVTNMSDAEVAVNKAAEAFGGIHYLCNSAGLQSYGTVVSTDEDTWDKTIDVNLKSIYVVSKFCIPHILKQGGGAVVNISSVQGLRCQSNLSAYAASKGGVIALTRSMALDYAKQNIHINCICPGSIDTPLLRYGAAQHGEEEEVLKQWGNHHPIGRIGTTEEIAQTVLFLLSRESAFMIGQPVVVDGGLMSKIL